MKNKKNIFLTSLLLTILIFVSGMLLNYGLDFVRLNVVSDVMLNHELSTDAYLAEREFTELFGGSSCDIMNTRIISLKEEIHKVGADLGSYSRFSFFNKKDFDYLKRKYFLLQLRFLSHIEQLNKACGKSIVPIIFFYEIDQEASERQGFILQDVSKNFNDSVIVITLDKDYEDEPLVKLLALKFNVTRAPTIIIADDARSGLIYDKELTAIIQDKIMNTNETIPSEE
ncbi:conjugal transfer protein TraF [Candidatus Woesearchaeota archaeon]|nr:conjugal transfer protein TraF [Candidatus Woesearchaeota archaeon]MBW2993804.1 conjugal transfer protein TraF [Candidatus Woesearchaeota archaeon]